MRGRGFGAGGVRRTGLSAVEDAAEGGAGIAEDATEIGVATGALGSVLGALEGIQDDEIAFCASGGASSVAVKSPQTPRAAKGTRASATRSTTARAARWRLRAGRADAAARASGWHGETGPPGGRRKSEVR